MTERALKRLLLISCALLAVWGIVVLRSRREDRGPEVPTALAAFLGGATDASVAFVRLEGPTDTVLLERVNEHWSANGWRADSGAVARFWTALQTARVAGIIATNPSNHRRMGVSDDSTWRVSLDVAGEVRSLVVGKSGPRPATTYVRLPGSDTVHLLESELGLRVALSADDWRNRRILAVDTSATASIHVELDGQSYTTVRRADSWMLSSGEQADSTAIRIMLTELASLRALGFLERDDAIAQSPRAGGILVLSAAADTLARLILGTGPGDRWARARGDSTLYRIGYYRVERIAPARQHIVRSY